MRKTKATTTPFGTLLDEIRELYQHTIQEMSEQLEVSRVHVQQLRTGLRPPSMNIIRRLIRVYPEAYRRREEVLKTAMKERKDFRLIVNPRKTKHAELAWCFIERFDKLSGEQVQAIMEILQSGN